MWRLAMRCLVRGRWTIGWHRVARSRHLLGRSIVWCLWVRMRWIMSFLWRRRTCSSRLMYRWVWTGVSTILKTQTRHLSLHILNHFSALDTPCHHKITALLLHIRDCILLTPTKTISHIAGKVISYPQCSVKIRIQDPPRQVT